MSDSPSFGLTGLATMGANLARNVAHHDIPVVVQNRTQERTDRFMEEHGGEGAISSVSELADFAGALARPRVVMTMVQAGKAVDAVIDELVEHLDEGDVVVDGGNSHFRDTERRGEALAARGIHFIGTGVSGGEEGALKGPSIMPGGPEEAYAIVEETLTTVSAHVDGTPCCVHVGPGGAGHYVKMVHNGIEYADMQLIAEAYDLLHHGYGMPVDEVADVFRGWNEGPLESFLIETTADVVAQADPRGGGALIDVVLDQAEQKGTGRWTAIDALELGQPLTAITEAVYARALSALGDERRRAAGVLRGPDGQGTLKDGFVDDLGSALLASKVVAYAQGFAQIEAASDEHSWGVDLGAMATIWRGGCIIRARFLDEVREAYEREPDVPSLLLAEPFTTRVGDAQDAWRRVVSAGVELAVPLPAMTSALAYHDGLRRERGPAALLQLLRDFFGAHTYERTDDEGKFHVTWAGDRAEHGA